MSARIAIVLAAGKGTRMKSDLPKVLFPVCGRPLIEYVLAAVRAAEVPRILAVVGFRSDLVQEALAGQADVECVEQPQQLGTGHAVQMCRNQLKDFRGAVLVVTGDSPLTQATSLRRLLELYDEQHPACVLGTLIKDDPSGLGRIVRDEHGNFTAIVEQKDATPEQLAVREVNMSTYVFDCQALLSVLDQLRTDNQQGEYYITDCPGLLRQRGCDVRALPVLRPCEALSVNNLDDLRAVEAEMNRHES